MESVPMSWQNTDEFKTDVITPYLQKDRAKQMKTD